MNVSSSVSLSGMNAAQSRLQVSAHNVANLQTQGFNRQKMAHSTTAGGGTSTTVSQNINGTGMELETDMVSQLQAKNAFLANLSVFKTRNETLGTLLDIKA